VVAIEVSLCKFQCVQRECGALKKLFIAPVAQWTARSTSNRKVASSSLAWSALGYRLDTANKKNVNISFAATGR